MKPFSIFSFPSRPAPFNVMRNICWSDKFIVVTLFYFFLAYPFALRNVMGMVYPVLLTALLVATILACTIAKSPALLPRFNRGGGMLKIGVLLYALYFAILMMVSLFHSAESIVAISAVYEVRELAFALIILFLLSDKGLFFSLLLYVEVFFWCSVLGLLLVLLNFMGAIQPITEVNLDNLPGGGENIRLFFGIGFIWPNTWLGSPIGLERLQSFADEAGTFAFAALPAILLAANWGMKVRAFIMVVALIFTFSVGAISIWVFVTLLGLLASIAHEGIKVKRVLTLLLSAIVLLLIISNFPFDLLEQADRYFSAKYDSTGVAESSVGQRLVGLKIAFEYIQEHPFGFGVNSSGLVLDLGGASLAIGWFIPLVEAGVVGWLVYVLAFGLILLHALRKTIVSTGIKQIVAIVILINGYAAFQRAGIDANIWQLFWLIVYIRVVGMDDEIINLYDSKSKLTKPIDCLSVRMVSIKNVS